MRLLLSRYNHDRKCLKSLLVSTLILSQSVSSTLSYPVTLSGHEYVDPAQEIASVENVEGPAFQQAYSLPLHVLGRHGSSSFNGASSHFVKRAPVVITEEGVTTRYGETSNRVPEPSANPKPAAQPQVPKAADTKSNTHNVPSTQPKAPRASDTQPSAPKTPVTQPTAPKTPVTQPSAPHVSAYTSSNPSSKVGIAKKRGGMRKGMKYAGGAVALAGTVALGYSILSRDVEESSLIVKREPTPVTITEVLPDEIVTVDKVASAKAVYGPLPSDIPAGKKVSKAIVPAKKGMGVGKGLAIAGAVAASGAAIYGLYRFIKHGKKKDKEQKSVEGPK